MLVSADFCSLIRNMTEDLLNIVLKLKWLNKSKLFLLCSLKCLERNFLRLAPVEESKSWNHAFPEMFCFVFPLLKWSPSTFRNSRYCLLYIKAAFQDINIYGLSKLCLNFFLKKLIEWVWACYQCRIISA